MKKSYSLRRQLFGLMALLVFLQSAALVLSLFVSRVFFMLDAEAFRLFDNATRTRQQTYNASISNLVTGMAAEAKRLSDSLESMAQESGTTPRQLPDSDDAYASATQIAAQALIDLLKKNEISGAFLLLDGSGASERHGGVYIRNVGIGSATGDTGSYQLEIGPIAVSQAFTIPTSINWQLDLSIQMADEEASAFYRKPMEAARSFPRAEFERYGYWSTPQALLDDHLQVVSFTLPLIGADGEPFGVIGAEISIALFTQHYLPNTDLPYSNSFYSIMGYVEEPPALDLRWFIPSGPLAQVYLREGNELPLKAVRGTEVYETALSGLGSMYCSIRPLVMYSQNSPFYGERWMLVGFVPTGVLHETSQGIRSTLITSIALTTLVSFLAIFLLTYVTTRKISGLSKYVQGLSPYMDIRFRRTGIREIDELTGAVEMLNRSVVNASKTTSRILELTLLPIGGFEVTSESNYVILTEYAQSLLGLPAGAMVTRAQWEAIHAGLVAHPSEHYDDIYAYRDASGAQRWLQIKEVKTDTGAVGVIFDVSKDIEERRQLAHELDYDALTHLLNRNAFKRKVQRRILDQPNQIGVMLFVDLDNLKYVNDTFGHDMGDRLIIRAGELFRQFEQYGGVVSRISGDEFAIYMHGFHSKAEPMRIIHALYATTDSFSLETTGGALQKIRFSSGAAFYPDDSENVTDLLKLSDYAMYEAKHNRKGTIYEFNRSSYRDNAYILENREAINRLLDEQLIRFAFQPIVDVRTGDVYAYEALLRPLLENFKSPQEILNVAAAQSKLAQMERLVLLSAFQAVKDRIQALGSRMVFINSIPSQTLSDEDHLLLERQYASIFPHVVIEMTETESKTPEQLQRKIDFIRKNHIMLALDDFGSGYSNDARILSMEPDIVKIDIALISDIDRDADKRKLVSNLVSFCHPKGIRLVAEGIERREELAEIIRLGIDYVQGFYVAKPDFSLQLLPEDVRQDLLSLSSGDQGKGR